MTPLFIIYLNFFRASIRNMDIFAALRCRVARIRRFLRLDAPCVGFPSAASQPRAGPTSTADGSRGRQQAI